MASCVNKRSTYGKKVDLLQDALVVEPSGQAFDPALGLGAIGDFGSDAGQLGALAAHNTTDERRQRGQVPSDGAGGLAMIPRRQSVPYGTISAEVVTHRLLLLDGSRFPARVYDATTSNYTLQDYLAPVSGSEG